GRFPQRSLYRVTGKLPSPYTGPPAFSLTFRDTAPRRIVDALRAAFSARRRSRSDCTFSSATTSLHARHRSALLMTLPFGLRGNASSTAISRGTLNFASRAATKRRTSSGSTETPARGTPHAFTASPYTGSATPTP